MPRAKVILDLKSEARSHADTALRTLAGIMRQPKMPANARVAAAIHLLDRGFGKADQHTTQSGEIKVIIRQLIDTIDALPEPLTIEHDDSDDDATS